ncbi:hypothetical protein AB0K08_11260 [Citricoccus sp. NPDC055426]|uniref:hypothetical protein n=1 Tax=Citricoccus sp. NPDC055426 TaxID=3155536 RepID=UPI00344927FB
MPSYVRFLKRRFLWAVAGLVVYLSYTLIWGGWFVRTLLSVTGLADAHAGAAALTSGQWIGLTAGSLLVMSPAIAGFLFYLVAWVGWPGRPIPPRRRLLATVGMGLGIAVTAFMLVGLIGHYWPVGVWRNGTREFAGFADLSIENTEWVGDMYFGLLVALIGLYSVVVLCSAILPGELDPHEVENAGVAGTVTGFWWPYAAGAAVVVLSLLAAVWPHLSP